MRSKSVGTPVNLFDITSLESQTLMKLFNETTSYVQNIRIEEVVGGRSHKGRVVHPATTIGLTLRNPIIQFSGYLNKEERIEAIGHELTHLLLVYRFGMGLIGLRTPHHQNPQEVFNFCMNMSKDWTYLLGQVVNTAHHLILVDYLGEEYGIESGFHRRFLDHNFRILANETNSDKESLVAKGLIAFEYEKLIGGIDKIINTTHQPETFRKAYDSAGKHFAKYSLISIPTSESYEGDILSFLEDLEYRKQDFIFFQAAVSNTVPDNEDPMRH